MSGRCLLVLTFVGFSGCQRNPAEVPARGNQGEVPVQRTQAEVPEQGNQWVPAEPPSTPAVPAVPLRPGTVARIKKTDGALAALLWREVRQARLKNLKPFVLLGRDSCTPCVALERGLNDELMIDALAGTHLIQLDVEEWEGEFTILGFDAVVLPILYELNAKAKPTGRIITGTAWEEDVPARMAPPLKAFFNPPEQ